MESHRQATWHPGDDGAGFVSNPAVRKLFSPKTPFQAANERRKLSPHSCTELIVFRTVIRPALLPAISKFFRPTQKGKASRSTEMGLTADKSTPAFSLEAPLEQLAYTPLSARQSR